MLGDPAKYKKEHVCRPRATRRTSRTSGLFGFHFRLAYDRVNAPVGQVEEVSLLGHLRQANRPERRALAGWAGCDRQGERPD